MDSEHNGQHNASVAYVSACPTTQANTKYIKEQLASCLNGRPPPDFVTSTSLDETTLIGYKGLVGLGVDAKAALGFNL